ncbi:MAG TPA: alkaline phosphatase family protein [Streptosporangiaceae bacterium]|nr:alkaline phosphatase family protein [Streptosporangiaceae bacterium]
MTHERGPGSLPFPDRPAGTDCLPAITHIVVLMKENHSYDNYFGMLGRGDGFTIGADGAPTNSNPDSSGQPVRVHHMSLPVNASLHVSQTWNNSHLQWNQGAMDGFVTATDSHDPMGYLDGSDLPWYYGFARTYGIGDRYFSSCLARTFPNRRFLQAATADGLVSTTIPSPFIRPPASGLIWDLLDAHGIGWANYFVEYPEVGLWPRNLLRWHSKLHDIDDFYTDCRLGKLPPVTLITPDALVVSEGEFQDDQLGEAFTASVFEAAAASPHWGGMLFIINWDEGGGFYDHVPPPPAVPPDDVPPDIHVPPDQPGGYDRYGFRVPCLVASPFSKPGHVSSVVYDHTSVLATIETKWNLPALTRRDAAASPLLDFIDLESAPHFAVPATLPRPTIWPFTGQHEASRAPGQQQGPTEPGRIRRLVSRIRPTS